MASLIFKFSTGKALIPVVIGLSPSNAMWGGGGMWTHRPERGKMNRVAYSLVERTGSHRQRRIFLPPSPTALKFFFTDVGDSAKNYKMTIKILKFLA
jgi:hypothetical protein